MTPGFRRAVALVAALNLGYFFVEFTVAVHIGSVSLFADSIDFLEDTAVNALILFALGFGAKNRARVGMVLAAILLVPAIATLWSALQKLGHPVPPAAVPLTLTGAGALAVNMVCAFMLAGFRRQNSSLVRAAYLSARNDAIANVAIIVAGGLTAAMVSIWPDLLVGAGIFVMNLGAAREVYAIARHEHAEAAP